MGILIGPHTPRKPPLVTARHEASPGQASGALPPPRSRKAVDLRSPQHRTAPNRRGGARAGRRQAAAREETTAELAQRLARNRALFEAALSVPVPAGHHAPVCSATAPASLSLAGAPPLLAVPPAVFSPL